jgi:hypothetical protein
LQSSSVARDLILLQTYITFRGRNTLSPLIQRLSLLFFPLRAVISPSSL